MSARRADLRDWNSCCWVTIWLRISGSAAAFSTSGWKVMLASAGLLGQQAALHGAQAQVALANGLVVGARGRFVELEQQLAFRDPVAFAHQHFLDDAAGGMLHRLALGVDGDQPLAGHAFVQRREGGPHQEAAQADDQGPHADAAGAPGIGRGLRRRVP